MDRQVRVFVPHVVVTRESLAADDPGAVVASNIAVVVQLGADALLEPAEICRDALLSHYVDFYRDQVTTGGFAKFVWYTGWEEAIVDLVRDGLTAIGAPWHSRAFDAGAEVVAGLGADRLATYVDGDCFGASNGPGQASCRPPATGRSTPGAGPVGGRRAPGAPPGRHGVRPSG
jgi:hypothetical protein